VCVPIELHMLVYSALLGFVQVLLAAHSAGRQRGYRWVAGARQEIVPPLTGLAHRFDRCLANFLETFPLLAALVLAALVSGRHGVLSQVGAQLYFWARVAYIPLYGVAIVRSLAWNVAGTGILLIAFQLLFPGMG
jgi:uncharacterized MAPEG superfamily protein